MTRQRTLIGMALLTMLAVLSGMVAVRGATPSPVIATIAVGPNPGSDLGQIAVDEQTGRAFVTSPYLPGMGASAGGTVSVLDTGASTLLRTVKVGANPYGVTVDTRRGHVFVGNRDDGTVSMLDARSGLVLRTIAVGQPLGAMAVDEQTARLFVPNPGSGIVTILDTSNGATVASVTVGDQPQQAAVDDQSGHAFITNGDGQVSMLDARTGAVQHTVRVKPGPAGPDLMTLTVSRRAGRVFVADPVGGSVTTLDARSGARLHTVTVGTYPVALAVDDHTGHVYVGNRSSHTVSVLDAQTGVLLRTVTVSFVPMDLTVDPRTDHVWVTTSGPTDLVPTRPDVYLGNVTGYGSVDVLDGRNGGILRTIQVGVLPVMTAVDEHTRHAFVLNSNADRKGGTFARPPEGRWAQTLQKLKHVLPWLPHTVSQLPPTHGSVTVFDATR